MKTKEVSSLVHLSAGATGGLVGTVLTTPLELLKTRQQSTVSNYSVTRGLGCVRQHAAASNGTSVQTLRGQYRAIIGKEGFRSLFKGLFPSAIAVVTSKGLFFFSNSKFRQLSRNVCNQVHVVHLISGTLAGVICALSMNPFWVVKTKLQLDEHRCSRSAVFRAVQEMWRAERHMAFFRGASASIVGSLEFGVYFLIYEELKRSHYFDFSFMMSNEKSYIPTMVQVALSSSFSKLVASTIMYPTEVVRTRMREDLVSSKRSNKYRRFLPACKLIYKEEGAGAFYAGWYLHLMKTIPFTIITFIVYESMLHSFEKYADQKY